MVPISGNHVPAFHTIQPSYILVYMQPYVSYKICNIISRKWGGVEGRLEFFRKFIWFGKNHPSLFSFNFQSHKLRSFHLVTNPTGEMWKYRANIVNGSTNLGDLLPTQQPKSKTKTAWITVSKRTCSQQCVSIFARQVLSRSVGFFFETYKKQFCSLCFLF